MMRPSLPLTLILAVSGSLANAQATNFAYEDLRDLIVNKSVNSIEALLPLLPEEMRTHYTLMHSSMSLHGSDHANPRVILFGLDAKLTCSFNGSSGHALYDGIECFQFREKERLFDFRQIIFPSAENGLSAPKFSEMNKTADGKVSCGSCHGDPEKNADLRPNWDEYPNWPGTYGSDHDLLKGDANAYYDWKKNSPNHPRYKYLIDKLPQGRVYEMPNTRFGTLIYRYTALRNVRILESLGKKWQLLGYAFRSLGCSLDSLSLSKIRAAKKDYMKDTDPNQMLHNLGIDENSWKTRVFENPVTYKGYEAHTGYGHLSDIVAMAIAQDLAADGNTVMKTALNQVQETYANYRYETGQKHFDIMNGIIPDPEFFGKDYSKRTSLVCPELGHAFVEAYLPKLTETHQPAVRDSTRQVH